MKKSNKERVYNVLDVSRYVINYCNKNNYWVSNLKLQKILYFVQALFITTKGVECFIEEIEAWDFGLVKGYGMLLLKVLTGIQSVKMIESLLIK